MKKICICILFLIPFCVFGKSIITEEPYNADNTGTEDCTHIFNTALINDTHIYVPDGEYRVDGIIELNGKTLELESGAWLKRMAEYSSNTGPVLRLNKNFSCLKGDGWIYTENDAPKGIVQIGHKDIQTAEIFLSYCKVSDVNIQGIIGQANKGVAVYCSKPFMGGGETFQNIVDSVLVKDVDVGIYLGTETVGSTISNIQGNGIEKFFFHLNGNENPAPSMHCRENIIENSFLNDSPNTDFIIKMEKAIRNFIHGIQSDGRQLINGGDPTVGAIPLMYLDEQTNLNVIFTPSSGGKKIKNLGVDNSFYIIDSNKSEFSVSRIITNEIITPYRKWEYTFDNTVAGNYLKIAGLKVNSWSEGNEDPQVTPIDEEYMAGVYYRITICRISTGNNTQTYTAEYIVNVFKTDPDNPQIDVKASINDGNIRHPFVNQSEQSVTFMIKNFKEQETGKIKVYIEAIAGTIINWPVNKPTVEFVDFTHSHREVKR